MAQRKEFSITIDCKEAAIASMLPYCVEVHEGVGIPFSLALIAFTGAPVRAADLAAALGAQVEVGLSDGVVRRCFKGFLSAHEFKGIAFRERGALKEKDACCYELTIESDLARLRLARHTRSFVRQNVLDVLGAILGEHGLSLEVKEELARKNDLPSSMIFTQAGESDYDFACRLCLLHGLNLVQDTFAGAHAGRVYVSDTGLSYLTYLEPGVGGELTAPRQGAYRCQMRDRSAPSFLSEVAVSGRYRPPRAAVLALGDDGAADDPVHDALAACYGYYETLKEDGSDDLEFVDMSAQRRALLSVGECLAPHAGWSYHSTDLAMRPGLVVALSDFYPGEGEDAEILTTELTLSYNVNYPQDYALHPLVRSREASVEAAAACRGLSLEDQPERLPVLGDAGHAQALLLTPRGTIIEGTVCDQDGKFDPFGKRCPCEFDHPQDPSFFYLMPRGGRVPVVVRNSKCEGGEARRYFPCLGDHAFVVAVGGRLQLLSYHPVLGQLSYLESTGMGTFPWLDGTSASALGQDGQGLRVRGILGSARDELTECLISGRMDSYIARFGITHQADTALGFYQSHHAAQSEACRLEYAQARSAYLGCKHSLIGKAQGLTLTPEEREAYEGARRRLTAARTAVEDRAQWLLENFFSHYAARDQGKG
ncbi:MAG: phage late control D family protein [Succinivibrionaceae bacterium]|nr:phage late control D family protein [Succinivibrionaceae bacterium]